MGADLILSWLRSPGPCSKEDVETAADMVVAKLGFDELLGIIDDTLFSQDDWAEEVPEEHWNDDGDIEDVDRTVAEEAGRRLIKRDLLRAAEQIFFTARRDTAAVSLPCECGCDHVNHYIFAGDMSWGDEPDAFRYMEVLDFFDFVSHIKPDLQHLADAGEGQ